MCATATDSYYGKSLYTHLTIIVDIAATSRIPYTYLASITVVGCSLRVARIKLLLNWLQAIHTDLVLSHLLSLWLLRLRLGLCLNCTNSCNLGGLLHVVAVDLRKGRNVST